MANLAKNRVGEADVSVVVGRRLFPMELYVSHYDTKEKRWKIDDCTSDVRYSDTNQKDLFRALYELTVSEEKKTRGRAGRPKSKRVELHAKLSPHVRGYLDELTAITQTSVSDYLSYLICKAFQGLQMTKMSQSEISELVPDSDAFVEAMSNHMTGGQAVKRNARLEMIDMHNDVADGLARKIRQDLEADAAAAAKERERRMSDLRNAEVEANAAWQRKGRLNDGYIPKPEDIEL